MHDYSEMRKRLGYSVNQTLDSPVMVLEFWEISEIFVALVFIMILGVLFYEWLLLCLTLIATLVGLPYLRKHFNKGIVLHYPYYKFGMSLPGLVNPKHYPVMSD